MDKQYVVELIMKSIRKKLSGYKQERHHMPFHHRLLGRDRIALYSFIHSLNTNFGPSIFEPVAAALAEQNSAISVAKRSHKVSPQIGEKHNDVFRISWMN